MARLAWLAVVAALWTGAAAAQATNILAYSRPSPAVAAQLGQDAARLLASPPRSLEGESDLACMAVAVYHEARGESIVGQRAVASVVLQRTLVPERWGRTPCEVVRPIQFEFMTSRWGYAPIREGKPWETALRVALTIMLQGPDAAIMGADHYHTPQVFPKWRHAMDLVAEIGNHRFYVDPISVRKSTEHGLDRANAPVMTFLATAPTSTPLNTSPATAGQYDWSGTGTPSLVPGDGVRGLPTTQVTDLYASAVQPTPQPKAQTTGGFAPIRGPDVDAIAKASTPTMGVPKHAASGRMGLSQAPIDVANANFKPLGISRSTP